MHRYVWRNVNMSRIVWWADLENQYQYLNNKFKDLWPWLINIRNHSEETISVIWTLQWGFKQLKQYLTHNQVFSLHRLPCLLQVPNIAVDDFQWSLPFSVTINSACWMLYWRVFKSCIVTMASWSLTECVGPYRS